jgi:Mg-chelatase subunit ChlD
MQMHAGEQRVFRIGALREECRDTRTHTDVALVLDMSTTMRDRTADGQVKVDAALAGARRLVAAMHLTPDARGLFDRVAIVGFNRTAWIEQPLTNDAAALDRAIGALPAGMVEYTRLDLAFARGAEALAVARDADTTPVMVVLTDGLPNRVPLAEDGSQETTVLRAAQAAKDAGITVYTIGVGRVDGPRPDINQIILMDRDILVGPASSCHIRQTVSNQTVTFFLRNGLLFCKSDEPIEIGGRISDGRSPLPMETTIRAGASFVIELSPTGLTHSSPIVCRRYMNNSQTGHTGPATARCAPTAMTT